MSFGTTRVQGLNVGPSTILAVGERALVGGIGKEGKLLSREDCEWFVEGFWKELACHVLSRRILGVILGLASALGALRQNRPLSL